MKSSCLQSQTVSVECLQLMLKAKQTTLGLMIWTSACYFAAIFSSYLRAGGLEKRGQEPGVFENRWMKISSFFVFYWGGINTKKKTRNSKIERNNSCENNCHRNMRGQSGHILPVMNSKYMWCIRVTLMAQLCHEKIQACTQGTRTLCFKACSRKTLVIIGYFCWYSFLSFVLPSLRLKRPSCEKIRQFWTAVWSAPSMATIFLIVVVIASLTKSAEISHLCFCFKCKLYRRTYLIPRSVAHFMTQAQMKDATT